MKRRLLCILLTVCAALCLRAQNLPADTLTMTECYAIAEANYRPLRLAREEIDTAGWKLAETTRNLYPALSVKAEETNGLADRSLGTPKFKEQSYGVQMNYALYEGGKSWATRRQAQANHRIARLKYKKTRQEMRYGIREAYWNLVRLRANQEEYRLALEEIRRLSSRSRQLFDDGVISEREYLQIESQLNQAAYQDDAAQADRENFGWKLADALGLSAPPREPASVIPYVETAVSIDDCLRLAAANNPEIAIQKEALTAALYGARVKKGYKRPKIDLNGFYGRSGSAYENEELSLKEDYQIGVQLAQSFLFNTFSGSGFKQQTSPKLGQSSRTEVETVSASMNLLDGYKQVAEEEEADLAYSQAAYGLEKAQSAVNQETRDAYFNYRKAIAQVKNTRVDAELADKELAISRISAGGQAGVAAIAEALNKRAGARAALHEAKTFYLMALAALDKAVGIENQFTANIEK